jgi:acyl-CoA-binding protein
MVAQSAEFKKAIEDSKKLTKTPTNDELLEVRPTDPLCVGPLL